MKQWISMLLFISTSALAQDFQAMSEKDMEIMMKQMQEMQACMATVDQAELKDLEQRWNKLNPKLKQLCNQGKRDEAQKTALSLSKETANNPAIQAIARCSENMRDMMPDMPFMKSPEDYAELHICDMPK